MPNGQSPQETEARAIGSILAEMHEVAAIRAWLRRARTAPGFAYSQP